MHGTFETSIYIIVYVVPNSAHLISAPRTTISLPTVDVTQLKWFPETSETPPNPPKTAYENLLLSKEKVDEVQTCLNTAPVPFY